MKRSYTKPLVDFIIYGEESIIHTSGCPTFGCPFDGCDDCLDCDNNCWPNGCGVQCTSDCDIMDFGCSFDCSGDE